MLKRKLGMLGASVALSFTSSSLAIDWPPYNALLVLTAPGSAYFINTNTGAEALASGCSLSIDISSASAALGGSVDFFLRF